MEHKVSKIKYRLNLFKTSIKKKFNKTNNKEWISKLINEIENHKYNSDSIPFTIIEEKQTGFLVKVNGLFAFISFFHMPWIYQNTDCWSLISPDLIGKRFYCKIYKISKDPLSILIDGKIPQFKKPKMVIGDEYQGFIINIKKYGLFIDIGNHFNWTCGSLIGLLHKSKINKDKNNNDPIFIKGQEIVVIYKGKNEEDHFIFYKKKEKSDLELSEVQELIGQIIWAKVIKLPEKNKIELLVRGKHRATLKINKQINKGKVSIKNGLKNDEIINCKIIGVSKNNKILKAIYPVEFENYIEPDNTLKNKLDDTTFHKLTSIKK